MCRLPLDLMTRIIEMVHVPLPVPGDPSVTWDNLRQRDLATLMRVSRVGPDYIIHEHRCKLTHTVDLFHRCTVTLQGSCGQQSRQLLPRSR
jgi:hypothetical protein